MPIEGFEEYAVNPFGDIISNKSDFTRLLSQCHGSGGYLSVNLFKNGKEYKRTVHRLVAEAFLKNNDQKPQVNHIDGDKENNRLDNLEYCTALENMQHAFETGLHSKRGRLTEDELDQIVDMLNAGMIYREIADKFNISPSQVHYIATGRSHKELFDKIDLPDGKFKVKVKCLENGKIYNSQTEAALDLNISNSSISMHLKGKYSQAKGYHFLRIDEEES